MASVVFRDTGTEQTDPRQQEQRKLFRPGGRKPEKVAADNNDHQNGNDHEECHNTDPVGNLINNFFDFFYHGMILSNDSHRENRQRKPLPGRFDSFQIHPDVKPVSGNMRSKDSVIFAFLQAKGARNLAPSFSHLQILRGKTGLICSSECQR